MAEILTTKNGAVGTITISNPTKMNAMSVQMWMDLPKAIRAFDADPEVRVIVIAGVGEKAFVSGADISQFDKLRDEAQRVQKLNFFELPEIEEVVIAVAEAARIPTGELTQDERVRIAQKAEAASVKADETLAALGL